MALIDLPATPNPAALQWRLVQPAQTNMSEWTGKRQTLASGRGWWECNYILPPVVDTARFNPWRAFVALARGGANEFRVPVDPKPQEPDTTAPSGVTLSLDFANREYFSQGGTSSVGTAAVNGGSQTGRSLITDGWPENDTVLSAGEFVTINDQLLQLTADVVSDINGNATITFEPPIRSSPADNDPIEYLSPYALMYLTEIPAYTFETGWIYTVDLSFREAF